MVLPDYQGIGVGKRLLNFIAELYSSQTKVPFYILTSNPQIIRGNMENWKITRFGHASKGREDTRINNEIRGSLSRRRITVCLKYIPILKDVKYVRSIFVDRVVDSSRLKDDARLTEIIDHGKGCYSVFAAKVITCVTTARKLAGMIFKEAS